MTITGNTLYSQDDAIYVENADNVTITGNDSSTLFNGCNPPNAGVVLVNDRAATVTGNYFHGNTVSTVADLTSTPALVCGNRLNASAYDQPVPC